MDRRSWPGVFFGVSGSPTGIGPLTFFGVSGSPTGIGPLIFWAGAGDEDGVTYGELETSLPVFTRAESKKRFKNQYLKSHICKALIGLISPGTL